MAEGRRDSSGASQREMHRDFHSESLFPYRRYHFSPPPYAIDVSKTRVLGLV